MASFVGGLLIAQQVAGRAVRDALVLSAYPVSSLPAILLISALVSVVGALAFAGALARRPPGAVLSVALALQAALLAAEGMLAGSEPRLVSATLYVQWALIAPGIVSGFWSLVNERFDPHTARRVIGRIGTGMSAGGALGGALAWAAARVLPAPALLPGVAALGVVAAIALPRLRPGAASQAREAEPAVGARVGAGFRYLRLLASVVALGALAEMLLDYLLKAGAARAFPDAAELAGFFSFFYGAVALLTLVVQFAFTRASLERVGLSGTVSVQPAAVALASAAAFAQPSLAAAIAARGLGGALRDSLFRSGYELFYAPLPSWQKRRSKALVDVAADKVGALAGGLVLIGLAARASFSERWLWLVALAAMLASVLLVRRLHHGYVRALEQSLRAGLVALEADQVQDSTTRLTLTRTALHRDALLAEIDAVRGGPPPPAKDLGEELRSGEASRIRAALAGATSVDPGLVHVLIGLLARDEVLPDVLRALRRVAPRATGQLVDALADRRQPSRVRRRIPRVLKACPTPRAVEGLLLGLDDPDFAVRRASGAVLAWLRDHHAGLVVPVPPVLAAVVRELESGAPDPEAQLDHVFALLTAVGEAEPLRVSRWALRGHDPRLRGTALEYLEQVLPEAVRQPLLGRVGMAPAPASRPRPLDEVEDELLRSATSLPRGLVARARRS